ncbi:type I restriction-modification system subunit M N-terminal domain-containing protein [Streptomyces sp. CLV115]|uniref:type I restriction-modification system subunit M N-terminal domain-containing protein n=1 Tax=Streptomyces sp. CLV115 TaxID=3138502 RepID=UPI00406D26DC
MSASRVPRGPARPPPWDDQAHGGHRSAEDSLSDGTGHLSKLVWSVADLLRSDFKSSEHGRVILPFTVLRWLDCRSRPFTAASSSGREPGCGASCIRRFSSFWTNRT